MAAKKRTKKGSSAAKGSVAATLTFRCSVVRQADEKLVLFSAPAKQLYSFVEINRREEDKDKGYQRALSQRRVTDIASYIDQKHWLPTGLVISLDSAELDENAGLIKIPNRPKAGWVIDGQHRLAGAWEAEREIELPVVAFIGLGLEGQIEQFVTINREQKGVPTSLYYELLPHLPGTRSEKEALQLSAKELAKSLTADDESPFYNRIVSTTSPKKGQLSLTNAIRKLVPHVKINSMLAHWGFDERRTIINNYYGALSQVFPQEYKTDDSLFFKTLGFGALIDALPTFMGVAIKQYGGLRVGDFKQLFSLVSDYKFSEWHGHGTGSAAEAQLATELTSRLSVATSKAPIQSKIKL